MAFPGVDGLRRRFPDPRRLGARQLRDGTVLGRHRDPVVGLCQHRRLARDRVAEHGEPVRGPDREGVEAVEVVEAALERLPEARTFTVMERRLMRGIINPAMVLTWVAGLWLASQVYGFQGGWLHAKIALVVLMTGLHGYLSASRKRFSAAVPSRFTSPISSSACMPLERPTRVIVSIRRARPPNESSGVQADLILAAQ